MVVSEVYIPIVFFLSVAAVVIMHLASRHRERLTMIEKGLSAEDIKALYSREHQRYNPLGVLKWGMLAIFVGAALLLGNYLDAVYGVKDGIVAGLVTLFAGVGLVLFYTIAVKKQNP
jgi:nitrate/nitrite transporter NarK